MAIQELKKIEYDMRKEALELVNRGFAIFPVHTPNGAGGCSCGNPGCSSIGKHPRIPTGVNGASKDPVLVSKWWDRWPDANIGLSCGAISGIVVIDIDGPEGEDSLRELEASLGPLPETVESLTGKGRHMFFKHPGGRIKPSVGVLGLSIDIRGDNSYIVAPPSLHATGRRYAWEVSHHIEDIPLAELPDAWVRKLREDKPRKTLQLDREMIPDGQRNNTLTSKAGTMRRAGFSEEAILEALLILNDEQCDPPLDVKEVERIAGSIGRYEPAIHIENLTDLGNARRLVKMADGNLRYLVERKKWLSWTGKRWVIDDTGAVMRMAKKTALGIYGEVNHATSEEERVKVAKHAISTESEYRLKAMVSLAESEPGIPISQAELDSDLWLLNCENGTIDLKTGVLKPHCREDFITNICPVKYDPEAKSNLFEFFLRETLPDPAVRRYVQKALGYSITGDCGLEKLFFPFGPSATGKSTLLGAVEKTLGSYAATANFESFLQRTGVSGSPRNDIARLAGKRFVLSVEVEEGKRLAEQLINQLVGGDTITARFLYSEEFEFRPQFKLWLAANNRPQISGPEGAIWRRLVQIPFLQQVPKDSRDPEVKARLQGPDRPAVLAWLVEGCLLWRGEGLDEPEPVRKLTDEYKQESDPLRDFIDECCVVEPKAEASNTEIWQAYQEWCDLNSIRFRLGRKRFSQALFGRGLDQYQEPTGNRQRIWLGIGISR